MAADDPQEAGTDSPDIVVCSEPWERCDDVAFLRDWLGWDFETFHAQEVIFRAFYGLPMVLGDREFYAQLTGDTAYRGLDGKEKTEIILRLGCRGGKSEMISGMALNEARKPRWRQFVKPGEPLYCIITATRLEQAQDVVQLKCTQRLYGSKLEHLAASDKATKTKLVLKNGNVIQSFPYNDTAARGLPSFMNIFDEVAHYRRNGPRDGRIVYDALGTRLIQVHGGKEALISTPADKSGLFYEKCMETKEALALGHPIEHRLYCHAASWVTNPSVDMERIRREYKLNQDNARREYGAEFVDSMVVYIPREDYEKCRLSVEEHRYDSEQMYFVGIDQSGLSGRDMFSLAIAHMDSERSTVVVDLVRSWDTRDAEVLKTGVTDLVNRWHPWEACIDRYAKGWVAHFLKGCGMDVQISPPSGVVYANFKSKIGSRTIELPWSPDLMEAVVSAKAVYGASATISITHERTPDGHGDEADAVARAVWMCSGQEERQVRTPEGSYRGMAIAKAEEQYDPLMDGLR